MTNPNDAAFSSPGAHADGIGIANPEFGLTKREYFAAMALGLLLEYRLTDSVESYAEPAVKIADALIVELNKTADAG